MAHHLSPMLNGDGARTFETPRHNKQMSTDTPQQWIAQFIERDPPRSKSLVTTIFGDSILPHGGAIWLGSLIELLAPFGIGDRLLRTSVFRLAQEGWLGAARDGRRSSYTITETAQQRFVRADHRIYSPAPDDWDGHWTLVMSASDGITPMERATLRKELAWEGFYLLAPGVALHPTGDVCTVAQILQRTGTADKVYVCRVRDLQGITQLPLRHMVSDGWDVAGVAERYRQFTASFRTLEAQLEQGPPLSAEQAFILRTLLMHAYRRVLLHDPQLPGALLPDDWPGAQAYALTRALYLRLQAGAEAHLMTVMCEKDPASAQANAAYYQRFGGLN